MKFEGIIPEIKISKGNVCWKDLYLFKVISVNTSSLFDGGLELLKTIRRQYPKSFLIRKDFIMIPRHIKESKEAGADAVLILGNFLTFEQYDRIIKECRRENIIPITETHYLDFSLEEPILVNSRDLNTGKFNRKQARRVCKDYKNVGKNVIYASGENSDKVIKQGIADAVLIGTAFMQGKLKVCK